MDRSIPGSQLSTSIHNKTVVESMNFFFFFFFNLQYLLVRSSRLGLHSNLTFVADDWWKIRGLQHFGFSRGSASVAEPGAASPGVRAVRGRKDAAVEAGRGWQLLLMCNTDLLC